MREKCISEALNTLVNESVMLIRLEDSRDMMNIHWAAQHSQADVAHVHIQAVFTIVEEAKTIRNFFVTRDTGDIHPGLSWFFFPIGKTFGVPVWDLVRNLHKLDIDRKTQLEHLEFFVPIHYHADVDLLPVGVHREVLHQL